MPAPEILLLLNLAATLFMTGLIWFVQIVHYPLFARVGDGSFAAYANAHTGLTTLVVGPPMLLEAATAVLLLIARPRQTPPAALWVGLLLVVVVWLSTVFLQVPQHDILSSGFNARAHQILVGTNWLRTAAWSLRALLMFWLAAGAIRPAVG